MAATQKVVPLKVGQTSIVPAKDIGEAVDNLLRGGWTRLEYPTLSRRFEDVISTFIGMTNDPHKDDYLVKDPREFDDGEPGLGLMIQTKGQLKLNPRPDEVAQGLLRKDSTKFKYHHHGRLLGYLGQTPGLIERHVKFFLETTRVHSEAILLGIQVAEELDRKLPGYGFVDRMKEGESEALLRLLRYLCDSDRPEMAQAHLDRDLLTVHIRSDRKGLFLADNRHNIIADAEEDRPSSILLFFGRKAWEITRGKLKGIIHGVIDTTLKEPMRFPRHTAVSFLHGSTTDSERQWALDHMSDLKMHPHVQRFVASAT